MNIFYLSHDVEQCAQFHTDKHVVKMIVEYAQLLSTAHRILDGRCIIAKTPGGMNKKTWILEGHLDSVLYKSTHVNHPSAVWARSTSENYQWLFKLWCCLLDEYTFRYDKQHASTKLKVYLQHTPKNIVSGKFSEPPKAMPIEFQVGNSEESYRNYYVGAKSHMFVWKKRNIPDWINSAIKS